MAVPVFAYMYFYRTDLTSFAAGIKLESYPTPTMKLGFYWDEACTQQVAIIDFGQMIHPNQDTFLLKTIYIRNEGDVWNDIYWNSTLSTISTEIEDWWGRFNNWKDFGIYGLRIGPGQVLVSVYQIHIPAYTTVGTYNWTLTAWGVNYY
jgi:hypothetical protein